MTNKVFVSRKWQQLSKILPLKRTTTKKPAQWNPKVNHTTPFQSGHKPLANKCYLFAVCLATKAVLKSYKGDKTPKIKHNVTSHFCLNLQRWRKPLNGKPKEKSTDGLRGYWRFTEKGQKWTGQLWTASPVVVTRKSRLRKAFPGEGCRGDMAKEPMVQQAETPAESPVLLQD